MIRLFVNHFQHPNPERQKEYDYCLNMNLINPLIDQVYTLSAEPVKGAKHLPLDIDRPTFNHFFHEINKLADLDDISIIANTDIYLNQTIQHLQNIRSDEAYALSRTDLIRWDSQDVWIIKGPVRPINADFCMGTPGCDNRIAYELDRAGYKVSNPSLSIHCTHVHATQLRNYDENTPRVPRPYMLLGACEIGKNSITQFIQ